jgi:hypothetical protein
MDILAHTLWTTTLARKGNIESKKKNNSFKLNLFWTGFFGIFPDLFAFTLPFVFSFYKVITGQQVFGSFSTRHQVADGFNLSHILYQYSHSLVLWSLVFLVVWLIFKRPIWELLGWGLHILIDIPSHSVLFFPTPFLFPVSTYVFPYGIAWSNVWFMTVNYFTLFIVWGGFLIKKYKKVKSS